MIRKRSKSRDRVTIVMQVQVTKSGLFARISDTNLWKVKGESPPTQENVGFQLQVANTLYEGYKQAYTKSCPEVR